MTARTPDLVFRLVVAALGASCALGIAHLLGVIALHVPFDPNEGWNAFYAQLAMTRGTPYPAEGGFLVNNYPPISFYLVGGLGWALGDNIIAGRIISLLAMLVVAFGVGVAARLMGTSRAQALFVGLLLVSSIFLTSDYAGMNDPQLLGHAVAIWGLVAIVLKPRTAGAMVLAALVFTLAFFVKHNLISLPISLAAWLFLRDRRHALIFTTSGFLFLLLAVGIFQGAFGTSFFHQIVSARIYDFRGFWNTASTWFVWATVPLCAALLLALIARRDQFATLTLLYAGISTLSGLLLLGGSGVDANALFDADIALSLCVALVLNRLENTTWSVVAAFVCCLPLVFLLRTLNGEWTSIGYWLHPMADERRTSAEEISLLRRSRGPILCEMLSLCYWAEKTAQVDVFNTDQRIRAGEESPDRLVQLIRARRYSIIQLETLDPFPLPPAIELAVMQNYRVVRIDDERVFFSPR